MHNSFPIVLSYTFMSSDIHQLYSALWALSVMFPNATASASGYGTLLFLFHTSEKRLGLDECGGIGLV